MWPDRIPHHSHIYTFRCHPLGLLSPTCHPTSRPQMQAGHLQEALPDSCPSHPPHPRKAVVSWSPRQGTPWEKYYPGSGGGGVCDTDTTAASVGTRIPITGPRPGYTRHPVVAEDGPLGLRQLLVETGIVQRGPVQPSRHRHSSGCSQKPCSGLQPARHAAMGEGEAEGRGILMKGG